MELINRNRKIIEVLAGVVILAAGLFVALFFIWSRCRAEYNADYTDTLLWANAAVKSGGFYDPDYWYAYFLPFSGIPIMIPIVAAHGLTYFSHELGMTAFVFILAVALYLLARSLDATRGVAMAFSGIIMILMCASNTTRMIFYGHIIHYSLVIVFFSVAFYLLRHSLVFEENGKHARLFTILIPIWCMLCTTNGMATIILFFVPFVGSVVLERYFQARPISYEGDRSFIHTVVLFAAGGLAGFAIKLAFFGNLEYEDSITSLLPYDGWVWNQVPFLLEWVTVLTGKSTAIDIKMMSFDGIRILSLYYFAFIILIVPVFAIISYRKITNRMLRLLIICYWTMFAVTLATYSVSYAITFNWRLSGLVCMATILTIAYAYHMIKSKRHVRWFVPLVPVVAFCMIICALTVKHIPSAVDANPNDQLISILDEHGLTRGYSMFWNGANAITVLSDNRIVVSPIEIMHDGSYEVRHYQSEPEGYEDVEGLDRYFVIVDGEDMGYTADTLGKNKIEEIKYQDNMYIWVYDRNIFSDGEPVFCD